MPSNKHGICTRSVFIFSLDSEVWSDGKL